MKNTRFSKISVCLLIMVPVWSAGMILFTLSRSCTAVYSCLIFAAITIWGALLLTLLGALAASVAYFKKDKQFKTPLIMLVVYVLLWIVVWFIGLGHTL